MHRAPNTLPGTCSTLSHYCHDSVFSFCPSLHSRHTGLNARLPPTPPGTGCSLASSETSLKSHLLKDPPSRLDVRPPLLSSP